MAFSHTPAPYTGSNRLLVDTFDDYIAKCQTGAAVVDDHIWSSPLLAYVKAADNKCGTGNGNIGSGPIPPGAPGFDPARQLLRSHACRTGGVVEDRWVRSAGSPRTPANFTP